MIVLGENGADSLTVDNRLSPNADTATVNFTPNASVGTVVTTATVNGAGGNDTILLQNASDPQLTRLNLLGDAGSDTFGNALVPGPKVVPSVTTTIVVSGGTNTAPPTGTTATANPGGPIGDVDVLNLDISTFALTGELVDTVSGQSISLSSPVAAHLPLYFNEIDDINLCDLGQLTNTTIGDLYVRTTAADESLVFYQGYTASADVLAKINGRLISNTPFRPTGSIIVYGRGSNDSIELNHTIGNRLRAEFYGEDGNDTLWGAALNDLLVGGNGSDMLISSDGNDTIWGDNVPTTWAERQNGNASGATPSSDSLYGGNGADFLFGQSGNDRVYGEGGDDYSHGGDGNDTMADTLGTNTLRGEAGADSLTGGSGNDIILGGDNNDVITGFGARDMMIGGTGLDNVQDTNDNAEDILIGDSSPLESDSDTGATTNFAVPSANDAALAPIFANWLNSDLFLSRVSALQLSGIKATAGDGFRDVLRGNQLNSNYFQNKGGSTNDLVRTTNATDFVDVA